MKNLKVLGILFLATILVSGCATHSWDGRVACATAGALGGAALGGIDDSDGALAGAAIGGLLGFIICPSSAAEPAPAPKKPAPAPLADEDGDGVIDERDRCPGTPRGARVYVNGCEWDSDGDGVVDSVDACPGTPEGARVDGSGCELMSSGTVALTGVLFRTNSAELRDESMAVLDATAETLNANPGVAAEIAGHTDSDGDAGYNLDLSERRANTVRNYLISRGVSASRLTAAGYGESQPVADNATPEGKAQNRRVELRVTR